MIWEFVNSMNNKMKSATVETWCTFSSFFKRINKDARSSYDLETKHFLFLIAAVKEYCHEKRDFIHKAYRYAVEMIKKVTPSDINITQSKKTLQLILHSQLPYDLKLSTFGGKSFPLESGKNRLLTGIIQNESETQFELTARLDHVMSDWIFTKNIDLLTVEATRVCHFCNKDTDKSFTFKKWHNNQRRGRHRHRHLLPSDCYHNIRMDNLNSAKTPSRRWHNKGFKPAQSRKW